MKIQVTDGLDKISLGVGMGSYLRINRPAAIIWPDCHGSVGQYLCQFPTSNEERSRVQDAIHSNVYQDYTGRLEELHDLLKPLLQLFASGEYYLSFINGNSCEGQVLSGNQPRRWYVIYSEMVRREAEILMVEDSKVYERHEGFDLYVSDVLDKTTTALYDWENDFYIATLPKCDLNRDRITFYKEKIHSGERPFAIIASAGENADGEDAESFILDGHHKLAAYQELEIRPPLVFITRIFTSGEESEFDLETLAELLYPWQMQHILDNWDGIGKKLPEVLEKSVQLKKLVKHGYHEGHYANGQIKTVGNYKYHRPEGTIRECYANGRIKSERTYIDNRNAGTWKEWFPSGQLMSVHSFDEQGRLHGEMRSYFEDGEERSLETWQHGQKGDGYSFSRYGHTRKMEYEAWAKNGVVTKRKVYNDMGGLIRTEAPAGNLEREPWTPIREEARYKMGADIYFTLAIIAIIIVGFLVLIIKVLLHYFA